jgi:hypothetical protein
MPIPVGQTVTVAVLPLGIGSILMDFLKVGEPVMVGIAVGRTAYRCEYPEDQE